MSFDPIRKAGVRSPRPGPPSRARRFALLVALPVLTALALAPSAQAEVVDDWYRGMRIRVATQGAVLGFTAQIPMDAETPSSNIHGVASDDEGTSSNSPSIPSAGRATTGHASTRTW